MTWPWPAESLPLAAALSLSVKSLSFRPSADSMVSMTSMSEVMSIALVVNSWSSCFSKLLMSVSMIWLICRLEAVILSPSMPCSSSSA